MTKTMSAIAVALLLGAAPMAYAQTAQHPMNANPNAPAASRDATMNRNANANRPEETIQPDQIRGSKMIGSSVYDVQNRDIGKVRDLILDKDGKVATVVIDVGTFLGMGGKSVGVQLSDLKTDNNRITLDRTKEQLQQMANYRLENRNTGAGSTTSPVHGGKLGGGR
ncbi:MAG: PRC-barrel domain-containing protein [Alphaproteobacteria bacterium]|nr:PRC-barrel domain-containing protein [Alphaproteobacteria bacterium]MBV9587666.1 PRC-barrel domain-containing protein [Alphaproteobacteria bacterium]MBV9964673.1 PRC-barrel domain-containing protein [Alphaproteobacteria bacterium]